jgi:hypothetical protein
VFVVSISAPASSGAEAVSLQGVGAALSHEQQFLLIETLLPLFSQAFALT